MKVFLTALLAAALASVLTLLLAPGLLPQPSTTPAFGVEPITPGATGPPSPQGADTEAQITASAALARVEELERELGLLRSVVDEGRARQPLDAGPSATPEEPPLAGLLQDESARSVILDIVAQKEADERRARREEREQRIAARVEERADEIARELGLNRTDRDALAWVMVEESTRRASVFDFLREGGLPDREAIRSEMNSINEWKQSELQTRFGPEMAGRIDELAGGGNPFGRGAGRANRPERGGA